MEPVCPLVEYCRPDAFHFDIESEPLDLHYKIIIEVCQ